MNRQSRKSRLSIDVSEEEKIMIKMWAARQKRSISDFVMTCVRDHMPCQLSHAPNAETKAALAESAKGEGVETFDSLEDFWKSLKRII
jgi:hypothetical protein